MWNGEWVLVLVLLHQRGVGLGVFFLFRGEGLEIPKMSLCNALLLTFVFIQLCGYVCWCEDGARLLLWEALSSDCIGWVRCSKLIA